MPPTPESTASRPRGRRRIAILVTLLAASVVLVAFSLSLPVFPKSFSGTVTKYGCSGNVNCTIPEESPSLHTFPAGSSVQFRWATIKGESVGFYVLDPAGAIVTGCSQTGTGGSCFYTASSGPYEFNFGWNGSDYEESVDFSGTFTAPVL